MALARVETQSESAGWQRQRAAMVRRVSELMLATAPETGLDRLDARVCAAMEAVPRHRFVPTEARHRAYADCALPIGHGQTISQPFIVALMTQLAAISPDAKVLEVGTGSGYQAAVLGKLAARVHSIEIVPELTRRAHAVLAELGYENVEVRTGDGFAGWPEQAPFDVILVTAAAPEPPPPLVAQLRPGGRMVLPLGSPGGLQDLVLLCKRSDGEIEAVSELPVAFVPLTREDLEGDDG
jgi:protein-L-isoaspartate(D-aspartate) O-methyltransferase